MAGQIRKRPFEIGDQRKRAVIDTVGSILDSKGYDVVSIAPQASVYEAIQSMADRKVGALTVVENEALVGIVSERDYARKVILQGRSSKEMLVREIMTPSPVTVSLAETVDECMRIMTVQRIRHLPVVCEGQLRGMISIGDLVKAVLSAQAFTIDQLQTYISTDYPV
jgi:CBS domain-containing protein